MPDIGIDVIKRCKNGDRQAFNEIFTQYQTQVVNMSYSLLSNREDALDAAQEVFVRVYRGIGGFKEKSSFSTWLYRITTNVCSDFLRKRQRSINALSISVNADEDDRDTDIPDNSPTPEEHAELNERQKALYAALGELKEEYRIVITLFDIEGLSYEEISQITKAPIGTIKSRLNRARSALKKILTENGNFLDNFSV
ncbi:MAG: sigma-70 family RNA polymerase sigma factor [Firmicutes bacterium]|nr:sigma-70 family RNA polymerase sigma factor [Bacillota bacterium]